MALCSLPLAITFHLLPPSFFPWSTSRLSSAALDFLSAPHMVFHSLKLSNRHFLSENRVSVSSEVSASLFLLSSYSLFFFLFLIEDGLFSLANEVPRTHPFQILISLLGKTRSSFPPIEDPPFQPRSPSFPLLKEPPGDRHSSIASFLRTGALSPPLSPTLRNAGRNPLLPPVKTLVFFSFLPVSNFLYLPLPSQEVKSRPS